MLADRLVVAKADLCDEQQLARLDRRLTELNPDAKRLQAAHGDVPPEWLLGSTDAGESAMRRRFERMREQEVAGDRRPESLRHKEGVFACSLACDVPLDGHALVHWLNQVRMEHGERLLRMKGIAELKGEKMPAALHGVHHVFHVPQPLPHLEGWRGTSLVLILRETDAAAVGASWDAFVKSRA
jgi:G3E family GTPase